MSDENGGSQKSVPRGGRKGGAQFPRYDLSKCVEWAKKLVARTHNSPQPQDVVYSGVVGAKSGRGDVRISCLKQYGLMEGTSKAYRASELARKINSAPEDELRSLYREAALRPKIFHALYETFQPDDVTRAKLKQRAADLNVHPEETEACVEIYIETLQLAGLVSVDGDRVLHAPQPPQGDAASASEDRGDQPADTLVNDPGVSEPATGEDFPVIENSRSGRAAVTVSITVDASLDVEKLEKQLQLLKRYGAL